MMFGRVTFYKKAWRASRLAIKDRLGPSQTIDSNWPLRVKDKLPRDLDLSARVHNPFWRIWKWSCLIKSVDRSFI
jgi:hypothetical protein